MGEKSSTVFTVITVFCFCLLFLGGTGNYIQGLALDRQALYHLSYTSSPIITFLSIASLEFFSHVFFIIIIMLSLHAFQI
jgi:hypothetical protein